MGWGAEAAREAAEQDADAFDVWWWMAGQYEDDDADTFNLIMRELEDGSDSEG